MKTLLSRAALAAAAMALGLSGANATNYDTKPLNVLVNVFSACSITAVSSIQFDDIVNGVATSLNPKFTTVQVTCNNGGWNIFAATDPGRTGRTMVRDVSNSIAYQLCVDQTQLTAYANCNALSTTRGISGSGNGTATIQAVMQPGIAPAAGNYTDVVTLQLTN